jgi:pimeloyl-ACP methyl ester carboxylesterase
MVALRSRSTALAGVADEGAVAATTAVAALRAAEAALDMPLLLLAAEESDVPQLPPGAFAGAIKALAERKPGSTFALIPGGRHYLQAQQPQQVAVAITQWLHSIEG